MAGVKEDSRVDKEHVLFNEKQKKSDF